MNPLIITSVLNSYAKDYIDGNLINRFTPITIDLNSSITVNPGDDKAFALTPSSAAVFKTQRGGDTADMREAIVRVPVNYNVALEWTKDKRKFFYDVALMTNAALISLCTNMGNIFGRQITADNADGTYFRQVGDDFELRFYLKRLEE